MFHSVFRHPYLVANYNKKLWNLACDIAVENMIQELDLECLKMDYEDDLNREI